VGPRAGLVVVCKRKIPSPRRDSNPDYPIIQPVARRYTNDDDDDDDDDNKIIV